MQSVSNLLQQGDKASVITHVKKLCMLQDWLVSWLPEPLNMQCQIVNLSQDTLILSTSSPVWATRLRYLAPQISTRLKHDISDKPLKIQVKVRPSVKPPATSSRPGATFSSETGRLLQQMANTIDHPGLSTALTKLAAHGRNI